MQFWDRKSEVSILLFGSLVSVLALSIACTREKIDEEKPAPVEAGMAKSFFIGTEKPKTFLCGWASVNEAGWLGDAIGGHNINMTNHCNLQFQITENALVGLQVNPSYPNDPKRWSRTILIPIKSHFYTEKRKDEYGRDTNEEVRNSGRSDWSARPNIELLFDGTKILDPNQQAMASAGLSGASLGVIESIYDVEFSEVDGKSFFAFTANMTHPLQGSDYQASVRFNFMEFNHNPEFKPTPYHPSNAKYVNALHILGNKGESQNQNLYVGKWDTKKKHKVYLHGFPKDYLHMGKETVEQWNDQFEKIGHNRPFEAVVDDASVKYGFDLRKTSIYWVEDKRISSSAPLGIGMAQADVRNGEIVWATVNMYGGLIREIINSTKDNKSSTSASGLSQMDLSTLPMFKAFSDGGINSSQAAAIAAQMGKSPQVASQILNQLQGLEFANRTYLAGMAEADAFKIFEAQNKTSRPARIAELRKQAYDKIRQGRTSSLFDGEYSAGHMMDSLAAQPSIAKDQSYEALAKTFLKEILLHEFGHIMGLGHNFKDNIIPREGDMPDKYIKAMRTKATKAAGYTQISTVMGYRDTATSLKDKYEDIAPGPHDTLMLRLLYNGEYPIYKKGDIDFRFVKLESDGQIYQKQDDGSKVAFFPACNDLQASLAVDPLCNRWASGFDINSVMTEYIEKFNQSIPRQLFAMSDLKGKAPDRVSNYLWVRALSMMTRVRNFYDYMRLKYEPEIKQIARSERMLYAFSCACRIGPNQTASQVCQESSSAYSSLNAEEVKYFSDVFSAKPEFKELCQANSYAVQELAKLASLQSTDNTKKVYDDEYIPGGITGGDAEIGWDHAFGTWRELGSLPIKFSAMLSLTTVEPAFVYGGSLIPIEKYSNKQAKYSYATLYPLEFSKGITMAVTNNMHLKSAVTDKPEIGTMLLYFNYFMDQARSSNDYISLSLPGDYWRRLFDQTHFNFDQVIVLLKGKRKETDGSSERVSLFEGTTLNFKTTLQQRIDYAYILPDSKLVLKSGDGILLPVTPFMPQRLELSNGSSYDGLAIAYSIHTDERLTDVLASHSVKNVFLQSYNDELKNCVHPKNKGLAAFFSEDQPDFKGFEIPPEKTEWNEDHRKRFQASIEEGFKDYQTKFGKTTSECQDTVRDLGLLSTSALVLNGIFVDELRYYFAN